MVVRGNIIRGMVVRGNVVSGMVVRGIDVVPKFYSAGVVAHDYRTGSRCVFDQSI
jgi:hypothetical protein